MWEGAGSLFIHIISGEDRLVFKVPFCKTNKTKILHILIAFHNVSRSVSYTELNTMELARFGRPGLRGGIITVSRIQCGTWSGHGSGSTGLP